MPSYHSHSAADLSLDSGAAGGLSEPYFGVGVDLLFGEAIVAEKALSGGKDTINKEMEVPGSLPFRMLRCWEVCWY